MDTMSIVTAHPALADGAARLPGSRHLPHGSPAGAGATSTARSRAAIVNQPNPLGPAALSYEGGAVATLDFTPEVARRKVVCSTSPTTT
ncbi:hypothetical protein M2427_005555 [Bradyrhizobium sp. BR13661]|jgi:hypothetical protein|nr:hypothetical protein [Bradyrhizobium sp. BR13661]